MSFRSSARFNQDCALYNLVHVFLLLMLEMSIYHIYSKMFPPRSCCSVDNPRQMLRSIDNIDPHDYTVGKHMFVDNRQLP